MSPIDTKRRRPPTLGVHPMNASELQLQLNSNYYLGAVSFTLLFYDYFLTLGWESARYWGVKMSWPTALFFANRYGMLLGNIPIVFETFWTTPSSPTKTTTDVLWFYRCRRFSSYHQYLVIVIQIIVGVLLILRTYALYERNKRVLGLMVLVAIGIIAVGLWATSFSGPPINHRVEVPLYIGCTYEMTCTQTNGMIIAWGGVGVFDCMIFVLTLYRALSHRRLTGPPLLAVLIRDGSIYFGVMVISNLGNILTFAFGRPYTRGIATSFTNIISSIMISRLMLNLRDPSLTTMASRFNSESSRATDGAGIFSTAYLTPSAPDATIEMTRVSSPTRINSPLS
ncbi:hypothetical protein FB451DRAFT_1391242 [Mycena latifolia]|nr:hypothetical protein FB451DRAFT_1391242 [Mycena latifolia]